MAAAKLSTAFSALKLKPDTLAAVNSFRRRHADLTKQLSDLKELDARPIDFANYTKTLTVRIDP
jgi:hypothetical protein